MYEKFFEINLDELQGDIERTTKLIEEIKKSIEDSKGYEKGFRETLEDPNLLPGSTWIEVLSSLEEQELNDILFLKASQAAAESIEYDHPIYRTGLAEACFSEKVLKVFREGTTLNIVIDMDTAAGTLEEYAMAVDSARGYRPTTGRKRRKEAGEEEPRGSQEETEAAGYDLSSRFWYKIYLAWLGERVYEFETVPEMGFDEEGNEVISFRRTEVDVTDKYLGKYEQILNERRAYFENPAPWWKLLDKGNIKTDFPSKGGRAFPRVKATNFVEEAEKEIRRILTEKFKTKYDEVKEDFKNLISDQKDWQLRMEDLVVELEASLNTKKFKITEDLIIEQLNRYGDRYEKADPRKLKQKILALAKGEKLGRVRVGGDVRFRNEEVQRAIRELEEIGGEL